MYYAKLQAILDEACDDYFTESTDWAATNLTALVKSVLAGDTAAEADVDVQAGSTDAAEEILKALENFQSSTHPCGSEVLEITVSNLLHDLSTAAGRSEACQSCVRRIISKYAATSNPRDAVILIIGELAASNGDLTQGHAILLLGLPSAIARLKRRQLAVLADLLLVAVKCLSQALLTMTWSSNSALSQSSESRKIKPHELHNLAVGFWTGIADAVVLWPHPIAEAARRQAAAHLLVFLSECGMQRIPVALKSLAVPSAALQHFQQEGRSVLGMNESCRAREDLKKKAAKEQLVHWNASVWHSEAESAAVPTLSGLLHVFQSLSCGVLRFDWTAADLGSGTYDESACNTDEAVALSLQPLHVGWAVAVFGMLCETELGLGAAREQQRALDLRDATRAMQALLQAASALQCVAAAQKGFALAVAAFTQAAVATAEDMNGSVRQCLELTATTMANNPNQTLRNCATHTLNAVLATLPARQMLAAVESVHDFGPAAVSAHAIQFLTRTAEQLWPRTVAQQTGRDARDWEMLRSRILAAALDWLSPNGKRSPRSVMEVTEKSEALCAALNLLRFLLLREGNHKTDHTGVRAPEMLWEIKDAMLRPPGSLAEIALHSIRHSGEDAADGGDCLAQELALARVLDVLTRVQELVCE